MKACVFCDKKKDPEKVEYKRVTVYSKKNDKEWTGVCCKKCWKAHVKEKGRSYLVDETY